MPELTIDLRHLDRVLQRIESNEDPGLEEKRLKIRSEYERVKMDITAPQNSSTPRDVIRLRLEVLIRVTSFVALSCDFYNAVRSSRPLDEEEKQIGRDLSDLLRQIQEATSKMKL